MLPEATGKNFTLIKCTRAYFLLCHQFEHCSKYDGEHDFDIILGSVVPCRKLRRICRKHSNNVARQVEMPGEQTIFVARHNFHAVLEVTSLHCCKTLRFYKRRIFSLIACEVLRHAATVFPAFFWYIIKLLFYEYLCHITF